MPENFSNKKIAKNTLLLYFRMFGIMLVSLYTSRIVLEALGVTDFGIYQTVGGVVGLLSFLNGALSAGSSRFLMFELGKGDFLKLRKTFSTLFSVHLLLGIIIIVLGECIGVWFVANKLNISPDTLKAAIVVFQFSLFTAFLNITQVPYTSIIIAHENLNIYAYISVVEVLLKLGVTFIIKLPFTIKLQMYAMLLFVVQFISILLYRIFCIRKYKESRLVLKDFDPVIFKDVGAFSVWSLFSNGAIAIANQGTIILLNNFFSPAVVTARTMALQVNTAANQFIQNFRTAANPQIVKKYSIEDYDGSKKLLLQSTYFSYYLILLLAIPIIILAEPLLKVWLGIVPDYAVSFLQWSMIQSLFSVFDSAFYTALYAKGQLKHNALIGSFIVFLQFPLFWVLFFLGKSPMFVCYIGTAVSFLLGVIIKPALLCKIVNYKVTDFVPMFIRCFLVTVLSFGIEYMIARSLNIHSVPGFFAVCFTSVIVSLIVTVCIGIDKNMRGFIKNAVLYKLKGAK